MSETTTPWVKASRSGDSGQCVELRRRDESVEVRDSKHPEGDRHRLTGPQFAAWLAAAKRGDLDHLA